MDNQRLRVMVLIVVFVLTFGGVRAATRYRLGQQRSPDWRTVPYNIDEWRGVDVRFDPIYGSDPADSSLLRVYHKVDGPPVIAYVGFFGDLATVMEVHTPELCYPAQGWGVRSVGNDIGTNFTDMGIPARRIVVDKHGEQRMVTWWYNAGSRPFRTRIRYVYGMLVMSAFTGRTDGSMVRLETPLGRESESIASARLEDFGSSFVPVLYMALPR